MKFRNRSKIVRLILNKVGGTRIFSVSSADGEKGGFLHIKSLINNVNSQGLAYFNSILSYIVSKGKYINESHKIG
jgi:hypothetical protein